MADWLSPRGIELRDELREAAEEVRGVAYCRDHEALEAMRQGRVEIVKIAACQSCGRFYARGDRCHYANDPADAILAAATETNIEGQP
ncbi:MAG: hypothetical protein RBS99_10245 [Rhodospirillales bacterium]|jgi:hypothetical protein|nr:hypothetical protein [Rhodospirillales bacterium]